MKRKFLFVTRGGRPFSFSRQMGNGQDQAPREARCSARQVDGDSMISTQIAA